MFKEHKVTVALIDLITEQANFIWHCLTFSYDLKYSKH